MPQAPAPVRWRAPLSQAARKMLGARWRSTLEALEEARAEYALRRQAALVDVRALRKAAQRVYDLEQLHSVLAHELFARR